MSNSINIYPTITDSASDTISVTGASDTISITGASDTWNWSSMAAGPSYTYTTGVSGAVLTAGATGSSTWATLGTDPDIHGRTLHVNGDADITGELTVQGVKLADRLDKIEERLGILRPNEDLEEKWDNLRALRNAYMELEAEIKEKEKVWAILKK